jgi:large subunit ribosomal protein L22
VINMKGYSTLNFPEQSARARIIEANISLKDSINIAHYLRGMTLDKAKSAIDAAIEKKQAVRYFRYLDSVSHRRGSGPGRYPVRALRIFRKAVDNVEANAEFKNLNLEKLRIIHLTATKGRMLKRYTPKAYGRAGGLDRDLINIEIVVEEVKE